MNTSYLKTFVEVINMKNISRAAEKLFVTQPGVSKQLQILEKEFGSVLIKKNGREILPTEEGSILYKYAINLLSEENKIYSILRNDDSELVGELCIYASSLPADYYLHKIIIKFSKIYPEITYNIKKVDSKAVFNYIEDGLTSFGFTGTPYKNKKIKNRCIANDEVIMVASEKKYGNYKNKTVNICDLLHEEFIIREKGSATLKIFEDFLNAKNLSLNDLNIKIQAQDNEIIKTFVKNHMGITVMSKISVKNEINDGSLIEIKVEDLSLNRELFYVYHGDRYYSKIEEKFKEYIINN